MAKMPSQVKLLVPELLFDMLIDFKNDPGSIAFSKAEVNATIDSTQKG